MIAQLRRLYAQGQPVRAIAVIMRRSRGSIAAQARRLGLVHPRGNNPRVETIKIRPTPKAKPGRSREHKGVSFGELKKGQCKFPYGNKLPYVFCGKAAVRGPYCSEHRRVCFDAAGVKA